MLISVIDKSTNFFQSFTDYHKNSLLSLLTTKKYTVLDQHIFYKKLKEEFKHNPTQKQDIVLQQLSEFVLNKSNNTIYLLKGYAGTGKTSIIGTLVKNLWRVKMAFVQMAPTGRAAKVISNYSDSPAQTIHRKIYFPKKERGGGVSFSLQRNRHRNTLFIVDEASMIPDTKAESKLFENGSLLDDLMQYVYSGNNCKLLLIGDDAQLPPVKLELSPALDAKSLSLQFNKEVAGIELDEVMRQAETSGILKNATRIRDFLNDGLYQDFRFDLEGQMDVERLADGYEIMNAISDSYGNDGNEGTAIILRSNKRANLYNQQIRQRILFNEEEISAGDYLMVVKNNYFWLDPKSEASFIANGDIIQVLEIFSIKELYGFRFAEVKVQMTDYPDLKPFETTLMLDTLTTNTPSLPYEDSNNLYQEVMKDYADESSKYKKFLKVKNNKFFNALQVKFSYAITCHKSQGGQWETIFVEQPYLPNGMDKDYLRWLYTAVTRARKKLYLIGFKDDMFITK